MEVILGGLSISLNSLTTYSSGTGLWTLGATHAYYNLTINSGRPLAVKLVKGFPSYNLPTGTNTDSFYYLFKTGRTIGLAASYADALSLTPIVFASAGDLFTCNGQTITDYTLQARVPECCDEPYFNGQQPDSIQINSYTDILFHDKYPRSVTIDFETFVKASTIADTTKDAEITSLLTLMNSEWVLYPVGGYDIPYFKPVGKLDYSDNYGDFTTFVKPILYYSNKRLVTGIGSGVAPFQSVTVVLTVSVSSGAVWYDIKISFLNSNDGDRRYFFTLRNGLTYGGRLYENILSGYVGTTDTGSYANSFDYNYVRNPINGATITFSNDDSSSLVLPNTLTLTKNASTYLSRLNSSYPTRGWTTNDYTSELPDTITLNKVAGYNNYESEFTTAVNVKNYIRIKLIPDYSSLGSKAGFKYANWNQFDIPGGATSKYLSAPTFRLDFPTTSPADGSLFYSWNPVVQRCLTSNLVVKLFRMTGIPPSTGTNFCYASTSYYLETPGYSPTPPPS